MRFYATMGPIGPDDHHRLLAVRAMVRGLHPTLGVWASRAFDHSGAPMMYAVTYQALDTFVEQAAALSLDITDVDQQTFLDVWDGHLHHASDDERRIAHVEYAYNPRQGAMSNGADHAIVDVPVRDGRLLRWPGDPLCKPARGFWGLNAGSSTRDGHVSCRTCLDRIGRYDIAVLPRHW